MSTCCQQAKALVELFKSISVLSKWPKNRHLGQMLRKPVAGLATQVVNDRGDSHQESGAPICAELSARVRIPKYHSMNCSMAYWWLRRDWAEASVLSTAARDSSNSRIVRLARRALAKIKCCHGFSFYAATLGIPEQARPFNTSSLITALPPAGRRQTRRATLRASKACRSKAQRRNSRTIGPRDRSSHR